LHVLQLATVHAGTAFVHMVGWGGGSKAGKRMRNEDDRRPDGPCAKFRIEDTWWLPLLLNVNGYSFADPCLPQPCPAPSLPLLPPRSLPLPSLPLHRPPSIGCEHGHPALTAYAIVQVVPALALGADDVVRAGGAAPRAIIAVSPGGKVAAGFALHAGDVGASGALVAVVRVAGCAGSGRGRNGWAMNAGGCRSTMLRRAHSAFRVKSGTRPHTARGVGAWC
jgi:hypothetical protein